jgi:2-keto-4-pentenoate hydratase
MTDKAVCVTTEGLLALRAARARRIFAPDELPTNITAAYALAGETMVLAGQPTAAWKLGATTAVTRATFCTDAIYFGALYDGEVWMAGESTAHMPPPMFRAEAEIAFRLAVDIAPYDAGHMAANAPSEALFNAWTPALEAPYSCIANIPDAGLAALLADRCAAGALFLGAPRADVRDPAIDSELSILVGGTAAAAGRVPTALLMSSIEAARGFIFEAGRQGTALSQGQWISTGGITPCIDLPTDGTAITLALAGKEVFTLDLLPQPEAATAKP